MACQEDCKHCGPEHCHAEALHESDQVGKGKEKAQLRDEHDCAKEDCRQGCHEDSSKEDSKKPKPSNIWFHGIQIEK